MFLLLFFASSIAVAQEAIVAGGNATETFGETFPIMQTDLSDYSEVSLGVPTFEVPIAVPEPKPIVKKKSPWQKFIEALKKLFR